MDLSLTYNIKNSLQRVLKDFIFSNNSIFKLNIVVNSNRVEFPVSEKETDYRLPFIVIVYTSTKGSRIQFTRDDGTKTL